MLHPNLTTKRALIIAALLLFSVAANAGHHRVHALGFIEGMKFNINQMENKLTIYANGGCVFNEADQGSIDVLFRYALFLEDNLVVLSGILEDPSGDLDAARRLLHQPDHVGGSASKLIVGLTHRARMLMLACPASNNQLQGVVQRLSLLWEGLDRVIWHVTDAIREEIYQDPSFE